MIYLSLYNPLVYKHHFAKKHYRINKEELCPLGGTLQETLGGDFLLNPGYFKEKYRYTLEATGELPLDNRHLFPGRLFWIKPYYTFQSPLQNKGETYTLCRPTTMDSLCFYSKNDNQWLSWWEEKPEDPPPGDILEKKEFSRVVSPELPKPQTLIFPEEGYFSYNPLLFCVLEDISIKQEDIPEWRLIFREL